MPGFRRSQTTNQSLLCAQAGCDSPAQDMCMQHMAAFCATHYKVHLKGHRAEPKSTGPKPTKVRKLGKLRRD